LAKKVAQTLSSPNVIDYLPLTGEYDIVEIVPPKDFIGKTLAELRLRNKYNRNKYNISILAVRGLVPESITMNPGGSFTVKDSDILIVLGKPDDIEKIKA
jgi:trk system potassium uptake protein TrkA